MLDFKFLILNEEEMKMRLLLGRDLCPKVPRAWLSVMGYRAEEERIEPRINAN